MVLVPAVTMSGTGEQDKKKREEIIFSVSWK